MSYDVPILLLGFNRPDYIRKVFDQIKKIKPQKFYVVLDGPRINNSTDKALCDSVKNIIETGIDWNCDVKKLYRQNNLGCKKSVSGGIDWFFQNEEYGIILEDDCVPNQDFFLFMQTMLVAYKDDSNIGSVAGLNLLGKESPRDEIFFSKFACMWGWGTWRRVRDHYNVDMKKWSFKKLFNVLSGNNLPKYLWFYFIVTYIKLKYNYANTWDGQLVFQLLEASQLSIRPSKNLIKNIGADGTHQNQKSDFNDIPTYVFSLNGFKQIDYINSINSDIYSYDKKTYYSFKNTSRYAFLSSLSILTKLCGVHKYILFIKNKLC